MKLAPRPFFALSALAFVAAAGFSVWRLLPDANDGVMSCSTKAIMRFENMEKENVNGNIHFNFAANGNGSMVVEGYTDSAAGWLYLQRYVKFSYTSQRISATERHYRIKKWESSALAHAPLLSPLSTMLKAHVLHLASTPKHEHTHNYHAAILLTAGK